MTCIIKDYEKGDYETYISALTKENMEPLFREHFGGWSDNISKKRFFHTLATGVVQLFFLDKEFIGYVSAGTEKNNAESLLIHDLHVTKKQQQQGYGTKILYFIIEKALLSHKKQLKVFVFKNNKAVLFYEKNGFKKIEEIKSHTLIMIKKLTNY